MTHSTVRDILAQTAARFPYRTAVRDPVRDETVTFAELDERARRVAIGLRNLNLEPGDHISALLTDSVGFLELLFASARAGLVFNPISHRVAPDRLAYVLDHAEPGALTVDGACLETVEALDADELPSIVTGVGTESEVIDCAYDSLVRADHDLPPVDVDEEDPALLLYTSGTTGRPKGVVHSHRNAVDATHVSLPFNRFRPTDVNVALGPLYHVGPLLCNVLPALSMGATNVVLHEFDPTRTLDVIESEDITAMWGVPTHFRALVNDESIDDRDVSHVRMIQYSGAAMPESVARWCRKYFTDCDFVNAYGTTEIVFGTVLFPEFHDEKLGSIGHAVPNATVRVVDTENPNPDATVPAGEVGELLVHTPTCMDEYWRDPEETDAAIVDGWYRTGDLGRRDEDGFLYFIDRKDDMIVSGGENVYPAEVEDVLHGHPDVASGAVVGVSSEEWGEVVTAFVVPATDDLSEAKLNTYFEGSDAIESFKRPRRYVFREELPMTASDKIDRRALLQSATDD